MISAKTGKKNRLSNERIDKPSTMSVDSDRVKAIREKLGLKEYEKFYANIPHIRIDRYTRTKRNLTIQQPYWFVDSKGIMTSTGFAYEHLLLLAEEGLMRVVKL